MSECKYKYAHMSYINVETNKNQQMYVLNLSVYDPD